jgi:hypothetical protein
MGMVSAAMDCRRGHEGKLAIQSRCSPPMSLALTAEVLHASTGGQGDRGRSEASVDTLSLTAGNNTVSAGFLKSRAMAVCGRWRGIRQRPAKPDDRVARRHRPDLIDEQSSSRAGDITVNALHAQVRSPCPLRRADRIRTLETHGSARTARSLRRVIGPSLSTSAIPERLSVQCAHV